MQSECDSGLTVRNENPPSNVKSVDVVKGDLPLNSIILGNCEDVLKAFPPNSIDLIITSPPYADARKGKYVGTVPKKYVEWFMPKAEELKRILKPNGTFILNIKEGASGGERHTYVLELILEMRKRDWLWTEEFVWHKKNSFPGKWPNRFRDGWERLLQFNKTKKFQMHQSRVKVKMGDWAKPRLKNLSDKDKTREHSTLNLGFGVNLENWVKRRKAYPDNVLFMEKEEVFLQPENVLHMPTECANKGHCATFPVALPEWFIKLFTNKGDVVLDPFVGSGTTPIAALKQGRNFIGIDMQSEFVQLARKRIAEAASFKAKPKE